MTLYIFILGIVALGAFVYYLFTKNLLAKRIAKIFGLIFLLTFILLFVFLYFHTSGEDKAFLESFNNQEVKSNIENYLDTHIITANFGGKVFCSYEFLGALGIEDRALSVCQAKPSNCCQDCQSVGCSNGGFS